MLRKCWQWLKGKNKPNRNAIGPVDSKTVAVELTSERIQRFTRQLLTIISSDHWGGHRQTTNPAYSLVGTAVDPNGSISQATLLEKRSNRYHFVTIGTKLGDITVTDIQAKRVILDKAGENITLKTGGLQLLTAKRGRGGDSGGDRGEGSSEKASNNNRQNRGNQAAEKRRQIEQLKRAAAQREALKREIMEKMRNASSNEERQEMMEYYKKEFGGKSGRDK